MSGDIDYYTTIAFIVQSAIVGLPVKVVAAYVNCPPFVVISRPEFKTAQDLKGKTMGIGAPPGSSPDVIAKLSLKHLGLNPEKDVKFVYLNSHERTFLALEQGLYAVGLRYRRRSIIKEKSSGSTRSPEPTRFSRTLKTA